MTTIDSSPASAAKGFDPAHYCPAKVDGVAIHDRGDDEADVRYVLTRDGSDDVVIISAEEKLLWDMFDGEKTVHDICTDYLTRYRTLVLNRVYRLLQRLAAGGFLQADPKIGATESKRRGLRLSGWLRLPLPGLSLIAAPFAALFRVLQIASWPTAIIATLISAAGLFLAAQHGMALFPLFSLTTPEGFVSGLSPRARYTYGIALLAGLFFIAAGVRELFQIAVEGALTKRMSTVRLVLNYFVPGFTHSAKWRQTLPLRQRVISGLAGLYCELIVAAIAAVVVKLCPDPFTSEIFYKLMMMTYLRVFLNLSPFAASDLCTLVCEWLNRSNFRDRAFTFLRHGFVASILGDAQLNRPQRAYLVFNLVLIFWLGLAATLCTRLLNTNQQAIRDIVFHIGGGDNLLPRLILFAFLAPIFFALISAVLWAASIVWAWTESKPSLRQPSGLTALSVGVIMLLPVGMLLAHCAGLHTATYAMVMESALYVAIVAGFVLIGRGYAATRGAALSHRIGLLLVALFCVLVADRVMGSTSARAERMATIVNSILLVCVLVSLVIAMIRRQSLFSYVQTPLFLPELVVTVGSLMLAGVGCRYLVHPPRGLDLIRVHSVAFTAIAFIACGLTVFLRQLQHSPAPRQFLGIKDPEKNTVSSLIQVYTYATKTIGTQFAAVFGNKLLAKVESRVKTAQPDFQFTDEPVFPSESDPEKIANMYRQTIVKLYDAVTSLYGRRYANQLVLGVFHGLHWECKLLLRQYILPESPWPDLFADEANFGAERRLEAVEAISIFNSLDIAHRKLIASHLVLESVHAGQLIARQGELGDACYVIVDGEVQVEERDSTGNHNILAFLRKNDLFGEAALLVDTPRMASIRACIDTTVLKLRREDFRGFATRHPAMVKQVTEQLRNLQILLRIPLFADVPANLLRVVVPQLDRQQFGDKETIITQGEMGDKFYLITAGMVDVLATHDGKEEHICQLKQREYFGEIALLRKIPRTATVRSIGDSEMLVLDDNTFSRLVSGSAVFAANLGALGDQRLSQIGHTG